MKNGFKCSFRAVLVGVRLLALTFLFTVTQAHAHHSFVAEFTEERLSSVTLTFASISMLRKMVK